MHAVMPGFTKCERLLSDKQQFTRDPHTSHTNDQTGVTTTSQSIPTLMRLLPSHPSKNFVERRCWKHQDLLSVE
eukprot:1152735-Pelagomonas_calceolata.AAC.4